MSGEMTNNSADNRALNAAARPRIRWADNYNGCNKSQYWKPLLHEELLP
jgi:hypothetical protein